MQVITSPTPTLQRCHWFHLSQTTICNENRLCSSQGCTGDICTLYTRTNESGVVYSDTAFNTTFASQQARLLQRLGAEVFGLGHLRRCLEYKGAAWPDPDPKQRRTADETPAKKKPWLVRRTKAQSLKNSRQEWATPKTRTQS